VLWIAVGMCIAPISRAEQAPSQLPTPSSLKWRPRRAPTTLAAEPAVQPVDAVRISAIDKPEPTPMKSAVRRAVAQEPVKQYSSKASRARLRNSVMQVGHEAIDPFKDPFEDEKTTASVDQGEQPSTAADIERSAPEVDVTPGEPATLPNGIPESDQPLRPIEPSPSLPTTEPLPSEYAPLPSAQDGLPDVTVSPVEGCESERGDCKQAAEALQRRDIRKVLIGLSVSGVEGNDFPCECELGNVAYKGRSFSPMTFTWKATGTCHKPLYFEDVQLERYGHSWNPVVQPFMSAAHFFVSIPLLPYQMGLHPPNECMYTLGYYRPGSCAPYVIEPIPLSLRGALLEAGAATAFGFLFFAPTF
jgi:hypothetical protein